jgi:thiol-disulfide isomerase/thioredoxin
MLKKHRQWLLAAGMAVLAVAAYKAWQSLRQPMVAAPALSGTAVDQRKVDLARSLKASQGKPVMVVFWATWCPECLAEQDSVQAISRDYEVIAVAWRSEGDDAVAAHMGKHGLTYPTLNDLDGRVSKAWDVRGVPDHFIVQPDGMTRFRVEGSRSEWKLRARLWWASAFAG